MGRVTGISFGIAVLVAALCCPGCGGGGDGDEYSGRVLTSNDFASDSSLVARNEDLLVVYLAAPAGAAQVAKQAAGLAASIPYYNDEAYTYDVCWEEDAGTAHYASLLAADGSEVFTIHTGECIVQAIAKGDYTIDFYHDGVSPATTVFLEPIDAGASAAEVLASLFKADAGQYDALIRTKACPNCNLMDANLAGVVLPQANLAAADLRYASLKGADLSGANLTGATGADIGWADLSGAGLAQATLAQAVLSGSNATGAAMAGAALGGANLAGAAFVGADLSGANLNGAALSRTGFAGANLSGATWVDGRACADGSIGTCN
jgi:hypothetical protein